MGQGALTVRAGGLDCTGSAVGKRPGPVPAPFPGTRYRRESVCGRGVLWCERGPHATVPPPHTHTHYFYFPSGLSARRMR